jgi:ArsR family transcriptional regulator, arsenate/arsenite/antimonite-responsive transcriptional repressor / arsenate reductase (thioredoxin)
MTVEASLVGRTAIHAALADPHRLEIVDELAISDRSPTELARSVGVGSNLLAHHLKVLEGVGIVERLPSDGDRRRRYIRLVPDAMAALAQPVLDLFARRILFVCRANSARSQLAAAVWNDRSEVPAVSAGTEPAEGLHPQAVAAASRAGLDLGGAHPSSIEEVAEARDLVVSVCDVAREALAGFASRPTVHWSVPDPARRGTSAAFDRALAQITQRIDVLAPHVHRPPRRRTRP